MDTLRDMLEVVLIALVLAILMRTFVIETYYVDGPSMEPTLWTGERLFVLKLAYRLTQPKRGDIIVFRYPYDQSRNFVKRVVAIPGDTLELRLGKVIVNGQPVEESFVREPGFYNMKAIVIQEGTLFVMGDHRTDSEDSRIFGAVSINDVKGKAFVRVWPLKKIGALR